MSTSTSLSLSTFKVDVTPPIGSGVCGGMMGRATHILAPNWVRGIVLHHGGTRYLVAAYDACYLIGLSQTRFEQALATGAGIPREQACGQSNHTHAAAMVSEEFLTYMHRHHPALDYHDEAFFSGVLAKVTAAVRQACAAPATPISGVGFSSHAVHDFASTRRVLDAEDKAHIRWSFCQQPSIKHAPIGKVDPLLDQIVFYDADGKACVALNYYASHPQVGNIEGAIHGDSIGVALPLFEAAFPGVFPIYFDGCGGDITAGKFTTPYPQRNNLDFGVKLFDAMTEAYLKNRAEPVRSLSWHDAPFDCPLVPVQFSAAEVHGHFSTPNLNFNDAYLWGIKQERLESGRMQYPFRITRLMLNDIGILMLPAELVVEYQLFAKQQFPGKLAVAAYGDSYLNYVGTDEMFAQGGYEVDPLWTEVGPGIEDAIKSHVQAALLAPADG